MEGKLYLESTQLWILENIMKSSSFVKRAASLFSAILVLFLSFNFSSCKNESDIQYIYYDLSGKWKDDSSSYFEISETEFKNYGDSYDCYAGNNLLIAKTSNDSGYIYIKYTKAMNPDYSYSETAPDVGKWYAIAFKDLTSDSVKLSGAYKESGKTSTETLEEAIKEFTVENGYFGTFSECTK